MSRTAIDMLLRQMEAAYRGDPFHALRKNLESVRPDEWDVRPAEWSVDVFGTDPELSICDIVAHVTGAKLMYANHAFGDASLEWTDLAAAMPKTRDMETRLSLLDAAHRQFTEGLAALQDDSELAVERPAPWRMPLSRARYIGIVLNHDLYHSGEINRQRALLRGAKGWAQGAPS